jgi:spore coat protein JB
MNYQWNYQREKLLQELMAVDFTLVDLNLYLNTHPCDQRAIAMYNSNVQKSRMLRDAYERMYGPLSPRSPSSRTAWKWINSPWPWEFQ